MMGYGDVLPEKIVMMKPFCKIPAMKNFTFRRVSSPSCSFGRWFLVTQFMRLYILYFSYVLVCRSVKSKAIWKDEMGMAEVIEKKGKLWVTTGITREGRTYCSIEETLYLMELGALHLLENCDICIPLTDIYRKAAGREDGCCWELFEVYKHLKSLGYIVGRHGVLWSMKDTSKTVHKPVTHEVTEETDQSVDMGSGDEKSLNELFSEMHINELRPDFDVFLPDNSFRKTSPGDPSFLLHLSRGHPPSRAEIEGLEKECGEIPLKISVVEDGRVSFFSFDKVELPRLP